MTTLKSSFWCVVVSTRQVKQPAAAKE